MDSPVLCHTRCQVYTTQGQKMNMSANRAILPPFVSCKVNQILSLILGKKKIHYTEMIYKQINLFFFYVHACFHKTIPPAQRNRHEITLVECRR